MFNRKNVSICSRKKLLVVLPKHEVYSSLFIVITKIFWRAKYCWIFITKMIFQVISASNFCTFNFNFCNWKIAWFICECNLHFLSFQWETVNNKCHFIYSVVHSSRMRVNLAQVHLGNEQKKTLIWPLTQSLRGKGCHSTLQSIWSDCLNQ